MYEASIHPFVVYFFYFNNDKCQMVCLDYQFLPLSYPEKEEIRERKWDVIDCQRVLKTAELV